MRKELFDDVTELLKKHGLTYRWMVDRLADMGFVTDKVSISKWAHGVQIAERAKQAHELCLRILQNYEDGFAERLKE